MPRIDLGPDTLGVMLAEDLLTIESAVIVRVLGAGDRIIEAVPTADLRRV